MKLHGQAGSTELFEVFQLLATSQKTGVLLVTRQDEVRKVQFSPRGVTLLFSSEDETKRLGHILVQRGRITRKRLEKTLDLQKTTRRRLGELLIQTGAAKAEDVNQALAYQLGEELFDLLRWEGASFDFKESQPDVDAPSNTAAAEPKRSYEASPYFDVNTILMEAARRADDWKRIHGVLTSSKTVLIRRTQDLENREDFDNPELVGRVWDLLDGTRNLEDLMERTAFSSFQVFETAYQLYRAGRVKLISPEELLTQAEEKLVSGQTEYGIGLLAKACEGLEKQPELQVQAGQLYFWAGHDNEARQILDEALHELLERGQLEVALKFLESLQQQYPDRTYSLERLVKLYHEVPDFESARPLATDLLSRYHQQHDQEKTKRLLKFLSDFPIKADQSRLSLAKLLTSFGEPGLAAEQYELLGKSAESSRLKKDAVRYYRQALHLDPSRREANRRLTRLTVLPRTKSRKLLKRLAVAVILLSMTAGMAAALHNELKARQNWSQTRHHVREFVEKQNFEGARQLCNAFLSQSMLTTTIGAAREELRNITAAENNFFSRATQNDRRLWAAAIKVAATTDYDAIVQAYEHVISQASQESMARKAGERLAELRRRRGSFEALLAEAIGAESRQDYAAAVRSYLKAVKLEPSEWVRRKLTLPVQVSSRPVGAEVWRNNKILGHTPTVLRRDLSEEFVLTVKMPGYLPGQLRVLAVGHPSRASIDLRPTRVPRWTCSLDGAIDVPLEVDGSRILVSSRSGQLVALEATTGQTLWTKNLGGLQGTYLSRAVRQDDAVYIVVADGRVLKLSLQNGRQIWRRDLGALLTDAPLFDPSDGILVAAAADGRLFGISTQHGQIRWTLEQKEGTNWVQTVPGGYLCTGPGSIRFLAHKSGANQKPWHHVLTDKVTSRPLVSNGRVYVPCAGGTLMTFNLGTGKSVARTNLGASELVGVTLSGTRLLVTNVEGTLFALDAKTRAALWTNVLAEPMSSAVTCHNGIVYVGTERGSLLALDVVNGKVRWQSLLNGPVQTSPTVLGKLCLVATRTGTLYAVSLTGSRTDVSTGLSGR